MKHWCWAESLERRRLLSAVTFQPQQTFGTGVYPHSVAVADLGNGHPDLVVANQNDATVSVLLGNGNGTFQPQQTYATGDAPYSVAIADLGNGHPDLVVTNQSDKTVSVLLGNGDGTFQAQQTYATGTDPESVAIADLGNGHLDLVVANEGDKTVSILLGNGDGTFQAQTTYATGSFPYAVAVADLGNGHPDLVVANAGDKTVSVLLGNGDGTFQPQQTYATGTDPESLAIADLGNGHPDVVVANEADNTVSVLLGNGDGTLQPQQTFATGTNPDSVAIADLGNSHPDVIVANSGDSDVGVLVGNGDGTFQSQEVFATGEGPASVAVADLGNGLPDLVVANFGDKTVSVLMNTGGIILANVQLAFGLEPLSAAATSTLLNITVDVDGPNGALLTGDNSNVTLTLTGGASGATIGGTTTVAAVNGVATFSGLTIATPGTNFTLIASDGSDTLATSYPFSIAPAGLASTIDKSTVPTTIVAGARLGGAVTLDVTNTAAATDSGSNTIGVYASADGAVDGSSILVGQIKPRLNLAAGKGQTIVVPINSSSVPAGAYSLIAQTTNASSAVLPSSPGPSLTVATAFLAFSETITPLNLATSVVSGTASRAMARVVIKNSGNVASKGATTIALSASTTSDVAGTFINSLSRKLAIHPNGGTATVLVPFDALPNLADNSYYIVASVTDPMGSSSIASSASTTTIAAPFITLSLAFGNVPKTVLTSGATLIITNHGNVDDTGPFTAVIGFSTDANGTNIVGTNAGTLAPARVTVRAGKTASIHVTGWDPLFKNLVSAGPYFLTVTLTDANGNSANAVSSGEVG